MTNRNAPPLLSFQSRGRGWLQRTALAVGAVAVVAIAFFFITVALIAGALLATGIAIRWWWVMRRLRSARKTAGPLEGEFVVIDQPGPGNRR
jgi:hypothetical protein